MRGGKQLWFMSCLKTMHRSCAILRYIHQIIYCKKKEILIYVKCVDMCVTKWKVSSGQIKVVWVWCVYLNHGMMCLCLVFTKNSKNFHLVNIVRNSRLWSLKKNIILLYIFQLSLSKCTKGWYIRPEYHSISEKIHIFFFQRNTDIKIFS